jgi:hypothetical protein
MLSPQTSCFPLRAGIGTFLGRLPGGHRARSLAPLHMIIVSIIIHEKFVVKRKFTDLLILVNTMRIDRSKDSSGFLGF